MDPDMTLECCLQSQPELTRWISETVLLRFGPSCEYLTGAGIADRDRSRGCGAVSAQNGAAVVSADRD